jgi:hypothetical protein
MFADDFFQVSLAYMAVGITMEANNNLSLIFMLMDWVDQILAIFQKIQPRL